MSFDDEDVEIVKRWLDTQPGPRPHPDVVVGLARVVRFALAEERARTTNLSRDAYEALARAAKAEQERDEARRLHSKAEGQIACQAELHYRVSVAERTAAEERHLADIRGGMLSNAERERDEALAKVARLREVLKKAHDAIPRLVVDIGNDDTSHLGEMLVWLAARVEDALSETEVAK